MTKIVLRCEDVKKTYSQGPQKVDVLNGIELEIHEGQQVAIVGASGSGKSTLLNVLGGLDQPDSGEVEILQRAFSQCSDNERGKIRNQSLGFVYQFHHLLPEFSALENVAMPLLIAGQKMADASRTAAQMLHRVGLTDRAVHKPAELSGGERQRVAIARALVNNPACVLMDEPTGNLDSGNAASIQALMAELSQSLSTAFIVVTHDMALAKTMHQVYELGEGRLVRIHG
ncbi:lipoprotein-releasing ABC transporter ATP-binding protein LolD [Teredinibacter turnerae]|uniref:lipoprotein-releasing ABC transporter ATP-binding protein LolD n=1 Tax=Teredinibacter turnerae TaxID=2426 RepID=UPI00036394DF|nr:lipoprotein-releasing ABC transporter ATP-binding protein LolD [Teredinibacter turnerae]